MLFQQKECYQKTHLSIDSFNIIPFTKDKVKHFFKFFEFFLIFLIFFKEKHPVRGKSGVFWGAGGAHNATHKAGAMPEREETARKAQGIL